MACYAAYRGKLASEQSEVWGNTHGVPKRTQAKEKQRQVLKRAGPTCGVTSQLNKARLGSVGARL